MAPTKMEVKAIKSKCDSVKNAVNHAEEVPQRVKHMLCATLSLTVGTPKADRHPFNDRFVSMIEQVLEGEQGRLTAALASQEAAFAEISPAKAQREAALEQAKAVAVEKSAELDAAKHALTEISATVKAASAELATLKKDQKSGDEEAEGVAVKKSLLEETGGALTALVAGTSEDEGKARKAVLDVGKSFRFDTSLMSTAAQVLHKAVAERGGFDATCLQQLQDAFASAIAKFDEDLAAHAPGTAARAAAVAQADASKQAAETSQTDLKQKSADAKEAKAVADAASKAAAHSLSDFMPDLKAAGDALDDAKNALQSFVDGPRANFSELKEFKEGDFKPIPKPKKVAVEETAEAEGMPVDHEGAQADAESPSKRARTE